MAGCPLQGISTEDIGASTRFRTRDARSAMKCPTCGTPNNNASVFCSRCGQRLRDDDAVAADAVRTRTRNTALLAAAATVAAIAVVVALLILTGVLSVNSDKRVDTASSSLVTTTNATAVATVPPTQAPIVAAATTPPTTSRPTHWVPVQNVSGTGELSTTTFHMTTGQGRIVVLQSTPDANGDDTLYWYVRTAGTGKNSPSAANGTCGNRCTGYTSTFNVPPGDYYVQISGRLYPWAVRVDELR